MSGSDAPFFTLRGVIEGFYGPFYSASQRQGLIRFLGEHGFNLYIYAPKNDRCHRDDWRKPYSGEDMAAFAETIAVAGEARLTFCYALSPSAGLHLADAGEFAAITTKLHAFYQIGARAFGLLMDDVTPRLISAEDARRYASPAAAQADLCNRVYAWLQELDPACPLFVCPTDYAGRAPFPETLHTFGALLHPAIELFYTGPDVCSSEITVADVDAFAAATGRPPVIWDNYPVNDLAMAPELHLGPLRGRETTLYAHTRGYVANLMLQPVASQIPLQTTGEYLRAPQMYEPSAAWDRALYTTAGPSSHAALRRFAETSLFSALYPDPPEPLVTLVTATLASLRRGEQAAESSAVHALNGYLATLTQDCQSLRSDLEDELLRIEIRPWLDALEAWLALGRQTLAVLSAGLAGWPAASGAGALGELRRAALAQPCRTGGSVLLPLADYALAAAVSGRDFGTERRAEALPEEEAISTEPPTTS